MATYIQGVTDYIPDFQPFQPDYNFYANVLQTKQDQYDRNYKQINNLYGQIYYDAVTRDDSNKMKDEYLKNIEYELKRVAGLDLSLEQNVNQARQIFKPIYENKNLMKDMALTKNYKNERSRAMSLLSSKNKDDQKSYWDEGIMEMDYRLEEFKNIDASQVLGFSNIMYTPFVNAMDVYEETAKKYNLSVDITQPDKSGMFMVRQKNGDLIIPSLQKLFYSEYASNPALQKVKATEAYVKRKTEAKNRAAKYNNNELLAEKDYLKEQYLFLQEKAKEQKIQAEENVTVSNNKKNNVENDIKNGKVNPHQPAFLQKIEQAIQVDDIVYQHTKNINDTIYAGVKSTIGANDITSVEGLDLDNIEQARYKVDMLYADYMAKTQIYDAADAYSKHDSIYKQEFSPVYMENLRHSHALERDAINNRKANERAAAKEIAEKQKMIDEYNLNNGFAEINSKGEIVPVTASPQYAETGDKGQTGLTDGRNLSINHLKYNRKILDKNIDKLTPEYLNLWMNTIKAGIKNGEIKNSDLSYLLGENAEWTPKMWKKYQADFSDPTKRTELARTLTINSRLFDLKKRMDSWAERNSGLGSAYAYNENSPVVSYKVDQMKTFYTAHMIIKKENQNRITNTLNAELKNAGVTDKKLRYTIIHEYLDKYITGKIYEDDDFNDHIDNIIENFKKKGVNVDFPGFGDRLNREMTRQERSKTGVTPFGILDAIGGAFTGFNITETMNDAYERIIKNPDHKIGMLSYLPTVKGGKGSTTGLGAVASSVDVNLARKDDNYAYFHQFLEDVRRINFNQADKNETMISLKGNQLDPNYEVNVDLNRKIKNMLFDLAALSKKKGQKDNPTLFKLTQAQIAGENADLGAMTIGNIPDEIINKYFDKQNTEDKAIINDIKTNGVTFMAPESNWKNGLFQSNQMTPTEAILNTGKNITFTDPTYGHVMILDKDPVTGNYNYNVKLRYIDEFGRYGEENILNFANPFGNEIDNVLTKAMIKMSEGNQKLKQQFEQFHKEGFKEGIKTFTEKFGSVPKNAGYKIN